MDTKFNDSRDEIIYSWFKKGEKYLHEKSIFEAFIYLWISWVVVCKKYNDLNYKTEFRYKKIDTDREEILLFCNGEYETLNNILLNHKDSLKYLANRKGSRFKNPIIDASEKQKKIFTNLSNDILGKIDLTKRERVECFAELLNKIRNNLFHGDKIYNDNEDRELIHNTVIILYDFVNYSYKI